MDMTFKENFKEEIEFYQKRIYEECINYSVYSVKERKRLYKRIIDNFKEAFFSAYNNHGQGD